MTAAIFALRKATGSIYFGPVAFVVFKGKGRIVDNLLKIGRKMGEKKWNIKD
ncbi:MAG: hypothetical protein IJR40_05345 [Treponema sp.]|nr:hypothetical protein [Treponema sp.]MBQ7619057.1 hypothetical protein [Treponema sp.]MBQ9626583.1 hypothetical protein [Treponema sp.]